MKTQIVNIYHKLPYDIYIGRAGNGQSGYFGNPITKGNICDLCNLVHETPASTLPCYEAYFNLRIDEDKDFKSAVLNLKGKTLGCFCKPKPCHGDVIIEWLNKNIE